MSAIMVEQEQQRKHNSNPNNPNNNDQQQRQQNRQHDSLVVKTDANTTIKKMDQMDKKNHFCLVCYSDFNTTGNNRSINSNIITLLPCDHNEICSICHLRLRYLHADKRCPICKQSNEQIICDFATADVQKFDNYPIWGDSLGSDYMYVSEVGMFFPIHYYDTIIKPLFGYHCTIPNCPYTDDVVCATDTEEKKCKPATAAANNNNNNTNESAPNKPLRLLKDHLRVEHRLGLCDLCVDNKRDFVVRLPRYSPAGLKKHVTVGDGKSFKGHPACDFCIPTRFYDLTALYGHLQKDHYKCHVCELIDPTKNNQYYKDYKSLEKHFDNQHYLCLNVQCLMARFVVFTNELDLRHHARTVHGKVLSSNDTKIKLEFRYRRSGTSASGNSNNSGNAPPDDSDFNYGPDGQAFVPPSLSTQQQQQNHHQRSNNSNNSSGPNLHPLHIQRTEELRQQAAAIRMQQDQGIDAFPSLVASAGTTSADTTTTAPPIVNNPNQRLNIGGWTASNTATTTIATVITRNRRPPAGTVTEEDFPSLLSAATSSSTTTAAASLKKQQPQQRSFLATGPKKNSSSSSKAMGGNGWASTAAAATTTAPPISSSYTSFTTTTNNNVGSLIPLSNSRTIKGNSSNNLAAKSETNFPSLVSANDFPSLSGGIGGSNNNTPKYREAEELGKKIASSKNNASKASSNSMSAEDFPSLLGQGTKKKASLNATTALAPKQPSAHPAVDSLSDFPTALQANVASLSFTDVLSIDEMKSILGQAKYKALKKYTKEFVSNEINPNAYIENAASLFDYSGYADVNFWKIVPSLIDSCPNSQSKIVAQRYMSQIIEQNPNARMAQEDAAIELSKYEHQQKLKATQAKQSAAAELFPNAIQLQNQQQHPQGSLWNSSSASTKLKAPPTAQPRVGSISAGVPGSTNYSNGSSSIKKQQAKKANVWGTGPAPVATRVNKAHPSLAASAAKPQNQSSTSYIAKQAKEEKWQQNNNNAAGKKKNKNTTNELRDLAFGK